MKIVVLKSNLNNINIILSIFISISLFLSLTSNHFIFWMCISLFSMMPFYKNPKYFLIIFIVFFCSCFTYFITYPREINGFVKGHFKIIKMTSMGPIVDVDNTNIFIHTKIKYNVGDVLTLMGKVNKIINNNAFDKVSYFYSLNTSYCINYPKMHLLETSNDIRIKIINFIINGGLNYKKITPLLLLGLKTIDTKEIYKLSIEMNIIHLFVISGIHISLFFFILNKILFVFKINKNIISWISIVIIFIYIFILRFPISASRAFIFIFLKVINKTILKEKFKSLEILGFTMAFIFIVIPRSIYSLSFIFTFISTFFILLINQFTFKFKIIKIFTISLLAFFSNLIISIYINHYFSLFGFFFGVLLSPIFMFMYILTIFLFPFKICMEHWDTWFIFLLKNINNINILVHIPIFNIKWVFLYYSLILSSIIITMTWNSFTEKKDTLLIKR